MTIQQRCFAADHETPVQFRLYRNLEVAGLDGDRRQLLELRIIKHLV